MQLLFIFCFSFLVISINFRHVHDTFCTYVIENNLQSSCTSALTRDLYHQPNFSLQEIPVWDNLQTPESERPVKELPWLQKAANDKKGLEKTLSNLFTLEAMYSK